MSLKLVIKILVFAIISFSLYLILVESSTVSKLRHREDRNIRQDTKIGDELDVEMKEISPKAVSLAVEESLNFKVDEIYVINFSLKINVPSELRKRQKLVAKFNKKTIPATGWAVAIRRVESSSRFEVYLQDQKGSGGWFTFAPVDFVKDNFYEITFVISPGNFMSGYMKKEGELEKNVIEMGTLPLAKLQNIESVDNLQITSGNPKYDVFSGGIKDVSIFKLPEIPNQKILLKSLSKGSDSFLSPFAENCVISFSNNKYKCEIDH